MPETSLRIDDSIHVRPVALTDSETVAELSGQLGYPVSAEVMRSRLEQISSSQEQAVFVACLGAEVIGWVEVLISRHLHSGSYALLSGLVVSDRHRSVGVGSRLCLEAEQWAREHGQSLVRVRSQISRQDAHRFYLREGYKQTKTSAAFEKRLD